MAIGGQQTPEQRARYNAARRAKRAADPELRRQQQAKVRARRREKRDADNARRRERWANDPTYRAQRLAEAAERRKTADPKKVKAYFRKHYYGLEEHQYRAMLSAQGGRCAICRAAEPLAVDHSHVTGEVRGLLCRKCNAGLGQFSDRPELLIDAAEYLRRFR